MKNDYLNELKSQYEGSASTDPETDSIDNSVTGKTMLPSTKNLLIYIGLSFGATIINAIASTVFGPTVALAALFGMAIGILSWLKTSWEPLDALDKKFTISTNRNNC